jgi:6-phosphogluconolactonase
MSADESRQVIPVADAAALAAMAAGRVAARIAENPGRIAICLAGGSSPKALYRLLATDAWSNRLPWERLHWFSGDERFVPRGDPLHNMTMARETLLDRFAPAPNIHPMATDTENPEASAARYERELKSFYGAERLDAARPLFDVVLLGIGPDGHTASIFPGSRAAQETDRWAVAVDEANVAPFVPRVTLTLPVLASSREMLFQVSGIGKRAILTRVLDGDNLPASRAHARGKTVFLADRAALPENFRGQ